MEKATCACRGSLARGVYWHGNQKKQARDASECLAVWLALFISLPLYRLSLYLLFFQLHLLNAVLRSLSLFHSISRAVSFSILAWRGVASFLLSCFLLRWLACLCLCGEKRGQSRVLSEVAWAADEA